MVVFCETLQRMFKKLLPAMMVEYLLLLGGLRLKGLEVGRVNHKGSLAVARQPVKAGN